MPRDLRGAKGLYEYFAENPEEARRQFFEPAPGLSRRGFFAGAGLAAAGGLLGMTIPFYANMPRGLVPAAFASEDVLVGKDGLTLLNDRPINAETPAHLLDDAITPTARHFIRNNGLPPEDADAAGWTLAVDGLVENPMELSIGDLKAGFEVVTMALAIECGGNGRAFFDPPAEGSQWTVGAVGCAAWTGVRLADVLKKAGVKPGVVYTAHYGADTHLSGKEGKAPLSRGVPIAKAMTDNVLIAFAMNGGPLHKQNGAPLRLVVPGWPGSCSQKWLTRIRLRDRVHDGPKMTGTVLPRAALSGRPGREGADEGFRDHRAHAGEIPGDSESGETAAATGRSGRSRFAAMPGREIAPSPRSTSHSTSGQDLDVGRARRSGQSTAPGRTSGAAPWSCPRSRLLRDMGPRGPTAKVMMQPLRHRLEPERLSQQHHAPRRIARSVTAHRCGRYLLPRPPELPALTALIR